MEICKGCKTDNAARFTFDDNPLCEFCAPIAANVVQVLENDHDPAKPRGMCCTACNFVKDCACGTCVGHFRARVKAIFGEVPERIDEMLKYPPSRLSSRFPSERQAMLC